MKNEFEKIITFYPSRSWLGKSPLKNYGNSTVTIKFILKGKLGAVQWMIGTDWVIEPIRKMYDQWSEHEYRKPTGWDLGYHSHKPMYEDQSAICDNCDVLGGPCYYDGSGLNADLLIEGFLGHGEKYVWEKLEEYYNHTFLDAEWPNFSVPYLPHPDEAKNQ